VPNTVKSTEGESAAMSIKTELLNGMQMLKSSQPRVLVPDVLYRKPKTLID